MKRVWMTPQERQVWRMTWASRYSSGVSAEEAARTADEALVALRAIGLQPVSGKSVRDAMGLERAELVGYRFPAGRGSKTGGV